MFKKIQYLAMIITIVSAVGAMAINFYLKKEFAWPAIAAIWTSLCLGQQVTIDRLERKVGHGIKN